MTTLELFTKRNRFYYISLIITIITFSFIAQGESPLMPLYDTLLIVCSLWSAAFLVIAGTGVARTYVADGELVLGDEYLIIDGSKISLNNLISIDFKIQPRSKKSWILDNNLLEIKDKYGICKKRRFAITSYEQNAEFEEVLHQWRSAGVPFNLSFRSFGL